MKFQVATDSLYLTISDDRAVFGRRDRSDTPHVTLLWETQSGELDLHMKWEDGRADPYEPLLRVQKQLLLTELAETLGPEAEALVDFWRNESRAYRPGWLRRNGFWVTWIQNDQVIDHLREHVPRRKQKYRLDMERLVSHPVIGKLVDGNVYDPSVLHVLPAMKEAGMIGDDPIQVYAYRIGAPTPRALHLTFHHRKGRFGHWRGVPMSAFTNRVEAMARRISEPSLAFATPIAQRIHDALYLDELAPQRWDASEVRLLSHMECGAGRSDEPA
jgi:hypothetical protein